MDHVGVAGERSMALAALHVLVLASEGKVRGGVVELLLRLPAGEGVALLAVRAQLPGMAIFMTRQTGRVKSFEGLVQIANFDLPAIGR